MKDYLIKRSKEPSTWLGIINLAVAFGLLQFTPEQMDAVKDLINWLFLGGLAGVVIPDKQHN